MKSLQRRATYDDLLRVPEHLVAENVADEEAGLCAVAHECVRAMLVSMDRTAEATRLARTYVWWQEPSVTLADPKKLLCQILRFGRPEDYVAAEDIWGKEALRRALIEAGPGEIDPKSDHFWRLRFGLVSPLRTSA